MEGIRNTVQGVGYAGVVQSMSKEKSVGGFRPLKEERTNLNDR